MRREIKISCLLGISFLLFSFCLHAFPTFFFSVGATASFLGLVAGFIYFAIEGLKRKKRLWELPIAICAAFVFCGYLAEEIGTRIEDWRFEQHLSEYSAVVNNLRADSSFRSQAYDVVDVKLLPVRVKTIQAVRCSDEKVVAAFLLDTGIPLRHEGYVYADEGCPKQLAPAQRWRYVRHVMGPWYYFSDH